MFGGVAVIVPDEIDAYATAHSTPPSPLLQKVANETRTSMPDHGMMVGPLEGRLLETLVHVSGARRVLEIGTFTGYSASPPSRGRSTWHSSTPTRRATGSTTRPCSPCSPTAA